MKKVQFIIISTILTFGLIVSGALISNALDKINKSENKITVKGVAERRIKADRAIVNVILSAKNKDIEEAEKTISEKEAAVTELLNLIKIEKENYNIQNMKIKPTYIGESNKISEYQVTQIISVNMKDVDKIDEIYEKLSELTLKFNNLEVIKPQFYITGIERYKKDLLIDASKNAEMRAFEMLKVNNGRVGELKTLTQGQFEILEDKEDIRRTDEPAENQMYKKLRSVVTATYSIDTNK
ncbi:MAG: SIMPL domain-containing protein [Leptotrichiaceae bacterium]|nr:SIMPL domain-containing protein [Leptotrichiaceae bacterium]